MFLKEDQTAVMVDEEDISFSEAIATFGHCFTSSIKNTSLPQMVVKAVLHDHSEKMEKTKSLKYLAEL
jgi:hypothetical protein